MTEVSKGTRLSKAAREFNVGISTIIDYLSNKGIEIESSPNAKISPEIYNILMEGFQSEKNVKEEAKKIGIGSVVKETISLSRQGDAVVKNQPVEHEQEDLLIQETTLAPASREVIQEENVVETTAPVLPSKKDEKVEPKVLGKIDLDAMNTKTRPSKKNKEEASTADKPVKKSKPEKAEPEPEPEKEPATAAATETPAEGEEKPAEAAVEDQTPVVEPDAPKPDFIETKYQKLNGPTILGKMDLPKVPEPSKKPVASSSDEDQKGKKKKRKRIKKETGTPVEDDAQDKNRKGKDKKGKKKKDKIEISEEDVQQKIKETLARLAPAGKSKSSKYRREKRDYISQQMQEDHEKREHEKSILKVTEFVTANELASLMNVQVTEIISVCMSLGVMISINQRLDAETLSIVASEFGFGVEFTTAEVQEAIREEEDLPDDLTERPAIVTVMGHVDHGKTSLLDYIRNTNVIAGEAGGITQHIGAYEVSLESGKQITFLDTPGHEAFTAMRARGAKVTDIAVIVIAADDQIMPQTREAINHAQAAEVPIIFAINKIDKPGANPEKVKEQLANMNLLVEDWGGKFQSQEISAKKGTNIDVLMEKILLEAELLDLKGNQKKRAVGTILESSLDKGRGYVAKLLVQNGVMEVGDVVLAGCYNGRVKAMYNERNQPVKKAGPSTPVLLLGLNGAPQAGDSFNVMEYEHEAKSIANKRQQLQREQGYRTHKHITLDEIGRRIAIGDFKELNVIVKADVDGSVEALSDSLIKLTTQEIQVNVIHKSVGQISESDILLASASDAVIIGFQVRPSQSARKLAEQEQIDIRLYSVIYDAIEELKSAMEGMLAPKIEEKIVCNINVKETYKITKVGTVAGCMVTEGVITRNTRVRIIRDGIVVYTGELGSLKRFKDDVKEVKSGYECGLNIRNFNDLKVGDIIEGYEEVEVERKL